MRYAFRSLVAAPAFSAGSVVCLSVGLTLTIAAFSLINAVFFRPIPGLRDQHELRHIWLLANAGHGHEIVSPSPADYEAMRQALAPVAAVTASRRHQVSVRANGPAVATRAILVASNYFEVLGTTAVMGRLLDGSDPQAAVISERLWRSALGARPDVLGTALEVNGATFYVVGVTPANFAGPSSVEFENEPQQIVNLWLPLTASTAVAGDLTASVPYLRMTARLEPGVSVEEVTARAGGVAASLAAAAGRTGSVVRVRPINSGPYEDTTDTAMTVSIVMAIPIGILAIACVNVANLLLARGATRAREIAVRLALGASRRRVVSEMMLESGLLAAGAAILAVGFCEIAVRLLAQWFPIPIAVDWRVGVFAICAAAATAIAFGLLPALSTSRAAMSLRMQDARPLKTHTRRLLVGIQLALSTALLFVAAILIRTVMVVSTPGHEDESRVLSVTFGVGLTHHDRVRIDEFERAMRERVVSMPGVEAAGMAALAPFRSAGGVVVSMPTGKPNQRRFASGGHISEGWLQAAGLNVLAGRDFTAGEHAGVPTTCLVNETLAAQLWPDGNGLGQSLVVATADPRAGGDAHYEVQVIGIVSNATRTPGARRPSPAFFLPSPIAAARERTLWVRTYGAAANLAPLIRTSATEIAPGVPIIDLITVAGARAREAGPYGWIASGMTATGMLALLLAAFGVFSLLTFLVAQRSREIGVRLAIGARPRDIVRLIVGESVAVAAGGTVAGGGIAVLAGMGLNDLYVGVGSADPVSFVAAAGVLIVAVLAASAPAALRASRTDPASVLRAQ